jgi:hypothetical protein
MGLGRDRLGESSQDLLAIVLQFRGTPAAKLESFVILERIPREQFEVVDLDDGDQAKPTAVVRAPKDAPCDNVGNPADPLPALMRTRAMAILRQSSRPTVRMTMAVMKKPKARLI